MHAVYSRCIRYGLSHDIDYASIIDETVFNLYANAMQRMLAVCLVFTKSTGSLYSLCIQLHFDWHPPYPGFCEVVWINSPPPPNMKNRSKVKLDAMSRCCCVHRGFFG